MTTTRRFLDTYEKKLNQIWEDQERFKQEQEALRGTWRVWDQHKCHAEWWRYERLATDPPLGWSDNVDRRTVLATMPRELSKNSKVFVRFFAGHEETGLVRHFSWNELKDDPYRIVAYKEIQCSTT